MLLALLFACVGATSTDSDTSAGTIDSGDGQDTGDTGDTADTDTGSEDTAATCETVNSGDDWAWSGACPQMGTPVAITVNGCEMILDYESVGGMTMGMPYSGTIDGDIVTFADDNSVDGCVGEVKSSDKITGSCADGCEFLLKR